MEFSLTPFEELRPGAWRAVAQPAAVNIGLVTGTSGALLIDTGSSPAQGAQVRAAAEAMLDVPLVGVVVTHAHFDHYYGLAAFDDLPTYGHESLAAALSAEQVGEEATELGFDPDDLRAPNRPLALAKMVDLGDRYAEIVHFGRGHTAGDVVVVVPDLQLIFTGDLLEQSAPPAMGPDCHLKEWPAALDGILGLVNAGTLLVPGHGFDAGQHCRELLQASQIMPGEEPVDVRQRGAHAAGERLVVRVPFQRVDPDDRVGSAGETGHFTADELRILTLPTVGDDHDDGAARQRSLAVDVVELLQRGADPRAAAPVGHGLGALLERRLRVARAELGVRRDRRVPNANASTPGPNRRRRGGKARARGRRHPSSPRRHRGRRASAAPSCGRGTAGRPGRRRSGASGGSDDACPVDRREGRRGAGARRAAGGSRRSRRSAA